MTQLHILKKYTFLILFFGFLAACTSLSNHEKSTTEIEDSISKNLTVFFVNDQHGQIDNFAKIKHLIDAEKKKTNVIVACSGDMFSGNPIVDYYDEKGYPMIDIMNKVGFDISVIGNHEFDYGEAILKKRLADANFKWVCANVNMNQTGILQPKAYETISAGNVKASFLGLIETNGKKGAIIPSTHPWRVENLTFYNHLNVVDKYKDIKKQENADVYIALTHLGHTDDFELAEKAPYFDFIIGGHSHQKINQVVNEIPVFQSGSYLNGLGKIELTLKNKKVISTTYTLIDLKTATDEDAEIKALVSNYNNNEAMNKVVGTATADHSRNATGCLITNAFTNKLQVDLSIQNTSGVRSDIKKGNITTKNIYSVVPFNNQVVIFEMSVGEMKKFLKESKSGFYFGGINIYQNNQEIVFEKNGKVMNDNENLKLGTQDYIAAVHESLLPVQKTIYPLNDAETLIAYLKEINSEVNFPSCNHYFKFQ